MTINSIPDATTGTPTTGTPGTASETARALFRVLETGDPVLAGKVIHPAFTNREASVAPAAASTPGPAGVLASSAWMRAAFSDLHFEIFDAGHDTGADTETAQDRVWLRLRMQGRQTGPFVRYRGGELDQAVPPTGRLIDFEQIHLLTLREGQVVHHEAVRDDTTMLAQLGVFPPSPAVALRTVAWKVSGRAERAARHTASAATAASDAAGTTHSGHR